MALSESGLNGGIGPMLVVGPGGRRTAIRPKAGPAPSGKRNFYVRAKSSKRGGRKK